MQSPKPVKSFDKVHRNFSYPYLEQFFLKPPEDPPIRRKHFSVGLYVYSVNV